VDWLLYHFVFLSPCYVIAYHCLRR
jgi:hypothetical protein